jgi:hypothetical protein
MAGRCFVYCRIPALESNFLIHLVTLLVRRIDILCRVKAVHMAYQRPETPQPFLMRAFPAPARMGRDTPQALLFFFHPKPAIKIRYKTTPGNLVLIMPDGPALPDETMVLLLSMKS